MTQDTFNIGDQVENTELNILGEIKAIDDEDNVTIHWQNGDEIVEETVALAELSVGTMNRYVGKATKLKSKAEGDIGYAAMTGGAPRDQAIINKRSKGIAAAKGRLGKNYKPSLLTRLRGEEVEQVDEDTAALASLKPHSHDVADPKSKLEVMKSVLGELGKMEDNDAVAFFHKVMGQFDNHLADPVGDKSASNRATLNMHPSDAVGKSVKEDVEKLFEGAEVTPEFKEKTTTLFEAALSARMAIYEAEIEEQAAQLLNEHAEQLEEEFGEALDEIDEQVETYMDYVATKWLEENEVAIESSLRNDLTQDFIDGIKELFYEHYIDIPEDRVDVVDELAAQIEEMQEQLNDAIDETVRLREIILEATAEEAFEEVAEGLAVTEQDKFRTLVESVDFEGNVDKFKEKLTLIKESHFSKGKKEPKVTLTDEFHGDEKVLTENVDPRVARYVQNLSGSHLK